MSKKSIVQLMAMTAMMSNLGNTTYMDEPINRYDPSKPIKRPTPPTPKGMKDWYIDGYHVQAVTKKTAIKKVNKLKSEQQ
jgi:hypothetical protein